MNIDDLDQEVLWRLNAFVSDLPSGRLPDGGAGGANVGTGGGGHERGGGVRGVSEQNDEVGGQFVGPPCLGLHAVPTLHQLYLRFVLHLWHRVVNDICCTAWASPA